MPFGIDIVKIAKSEVLKPDFNHNKLPDVLEALDAAEAAIEVIVPFLSRFDDADIRMIISCLPAPVRAKIPPADLVEFSKAVVALPAGLKAAKAVLEQVEAELKK